MTASPAVRPFPATPTLSGNNTYATKQNGEPSNTGTVTTGHSVWYKWTAPVSETVNFDTVGSSFNTTLVFTPAPPSITSC